MPTPQILGINAPSFGLTIVTLFIRWRIPKVPHYISTPAAAAGAILCVLTSVDDMRPLTVIAALAGVALLAFAVEWQIAHPTAATKNNQFAVTRAPVDASKGKPASAKLPTAGPVKPPKQAASERVEHESATASERVENPTTEAPKPATGKANLLNPDGIYQYDQMVGRVSGVSIDRPTSTITFVDITDSANLDRSKPFNYRNYTLQIVSIRKIIGIRTVASSFGSRTDMNVISGVTCQITAVQPDPYDLSQAH